MAMKVIVTLVILLPLLSAVLWTDRVVAQKVPRSSERFRVSFKAPKPKPLAFQISLYTANLQHGRNTAGVYDFANQAAILSTADLVGAQEVRPGDLPNWDRAFSSYGMNRAIYTPNSTKPNNAGDGQAIWYRANKLTILETYSHQLSDGFIGWDSSTNVDKRAVAVKVTFGFRTFVVVNTHLCWSRCADSSDDVFTGHSAQRVAQINELLAWISATFAGFDVVILGDMNLTPMFPKLPTGNQIDLFTASYVDLWQWGISSGRAFADWGDRDGDGNPDMPIDPILTRTSDTRRIDYIFLSAGASLLLERIELPDLRRPCSQNLSFDGGNYPSCWPDVVFQWDTPDDFGIRPSDHNWLKAVLR
jgi:endonuclease/exonuclease/phosphatase family metal-dependent hydrolase